MTLSPTEQQYQDQYYMQQAIELAKRGFYTRGLNPRVGCVIVSQGKVIGRGYHYQTGQPHAEVFALRDAQTFCGFVSWCDGLRHLRTL